MSYNTGPPWGWIHAKKNRQQLEDDFKSWRTELVKIGDKILQEMDKTKISQKTRSEFKQFIEKARQMGIYKTSSEN